MEKSKCRNRRSYQRKQKAYLEDMSKNTEETKQKCIENRNYAKEVVRKTQKDSWDLI